MHCKLVLICNNLLKIGNQLHCKCVTICDKQISSFMIQKIDKLISDMKFEKVKGQNHTKPAIKRQIRYPSAVSVLWI